VDMLNAVMLLIVSSDDGETETTRQTDDVLVGVEVRLGPAENNYQQSTGQLTNEALCENSLYTCVCVLCLR